MTAAPAAAAAVATTTAATATVSLSTGWHRSPRGDRQGGQDTEGPGQNSCMFRRHGHHSVAGHWLKPRAAFGCLAKD
jgi:hypothetical protein